MAIHTFRKKPVVERLENPHWEALTKETQRAFQITARLPFIHSYYLAGGTGLALHLGHRFSVDLDFFSSESNAVDMDQRNTLHSFFDDPSLTITFDKDSTFVATWLGVGISFFRLSAYPLVQKPYLINGVPLASIADIGAMKLAALIDRGTRKDMIDLYFILQHVSLDTIFDVAAVKYSRVRSFPVSAIRALAYFEDAEVFPMPRMIDRTPWIKMKRFLESKSIEAGRKKLADLWD